MINIKMHQSSNSIIFYVPANIMYEHSVLGSNLELDL